MKTSAGELSSFVPIAVATLRPSQYTDFALYIRGPDEADVRLYRQAHYPLQQEDLERLMERGIRYLYVSAGEHEQYQEYLRENFNNIVADESLPPQQRFSCLNEVVRDLLSEAFASRNVAETVETTKQLARHTVELISRRDVVARELMQVLRHDYHTFTHSANVSYYCVMLARQAGIDGAEELHQIATAGLLHDLGKLDVPESILLKPGRPNDAEWEIIKQHPTWGFRLLAPREDLNFGQLMMVYQHHERPDGGGYPVGVVGEEIHYWARICTIADVYEALTSTRPYRAALPRGEAVSIMQRHVGTRFDEDLWQCWKTTIGAD